MCRCWSWIRNGGVRLAEPPDAPQPHDPSPYTSLRGSFCKGEMFTHFQTIPNSQNFVCRATCSVTPMTLSMSGDFLGTEEGKQRDTAPRVTGPTALDTEYTALAALQATLPDTVPPDTLLVVDTALQHTLLAVDTALQDTALEVDTALQNTGLQTDTVAQG